MGGGEFDRYRLNKAPPTVLYIPDFISEVPHYKYCMNINNVTLINYVNLSALVGLPVVSLCTVSTMQAEEAVLLNQVARSPGPR